ncbi:MarR family transcriptional regulator [Mycolicibacterium sp. XJ2546]
MVSKKPTDSTVRELAAVQLATSDLVGVALRSVEDLEVSLPQFRLLRVLDALGEAGATRCAQVLGVGGSSITRLVDRLDASGHLVRRPDTANRSAVVLALTDEGRRLVRKVETRRRRELKKALDRLSPDERAQCIAALERLHDVLDAPEDPRIPY